MNRIRFFRISSYYHQWPLDQYLQIHLQISAEDTQFLIYMGALYVNFKRVTENLKINSGDLLRCHVEPKRFRTPSPSNTQVLFENEDFLLVNKPPGLPCQPTLDNRIENLLFYLTETYKHKLFITHRIDVGTEGLVVVAKKAAFQKDFNLLLESRQVTKIYETLTLGPSLRKGLWTHWMRPQPRAPKILSRTPVEGWKSCSLTIIDQQLLKPTQDSERLDNRGLQYYKIQLHTGRTHQIRAQLSFEQNPIVGDGLYGSSEILTSYESFALQSNELDFIHAGRRFHWKLPSLFRKHSVNGDLVGKLSSTLET